MQGQALANPNGLDRVRCGVVKVSRVLSEGRVFEGAVVVRYQPRETVVKADSEALR